MDVHLVDDDNFADLFLCVSIILNYILEEQERTGIFSHSKQIPG